MAFSQALHLPRTIEITREFTVEKLDIKIKNDIGEDVKVTNAGNGGSYSLSKNVTTTIKMEERYQLHCLNKGTKGMLILTVTKIWMAKLSC